MNKLEKIGVGAAVVFGLWGFGCAIGSLHEMQEIRRMLGIAEEHVRGISQVDIDQALVDKAVREAVKTSSAEAVNRAANKVREQMRADIANRVKQAVANQTGKLNQMVSDKIVSEMASVERDEIVKDVIEQTTEKLVEKLGDELDDEVGRIGKIYQGIAAVLK